MADELVLTDEQKAEVQQKVDEAILTAESGDPDSITDEERKEIRVKTEADALAEIEKATAKPDLSWLHTDKYGTDLEKAKEAQAKAYDAAVKEMQRKQQESADLRRRLEELENKPAVIPKTEEDYPDEFKRKLEDKYGNEYTFNQLRALNDIVASQLNPLAEIIFNSQAETVKSNFTKNKYYEKYKDEIDTQLQKLSLSERVSPKKIQEIIDNIIVKKFPEIIADERESALKELSGIPAKILNSEAGGGRTDNSAKKKPILTKAQREYSQRTGSNPDEIEKWLEEKETAKKTGWGSYLG